MTADLHKSDWNSETETENGTKVVPLWRLEHLSEEIISFRRFIARMSLAIGVWAAIALISLTIGMAGYVWFENMPWVDAYLNAAMILSGMGPVDQMTTTGGKIFAGSYALFSGFVILVATGIVIAPVFHRVLHRFHLEKLKKDKNTDKSGKPDKSDNHTEKD